MQRLELKLLSEIKIQNIVCTGNLKQEIDITSFNKFKHLSANLNLYRCEYVKDDTMMGKVTVFRTGKLISIGTKSPEQAIKESKKLQ